MSDSLRLSGESLGVDLLSSFLGFSLLGIIFPDSSLEGLSALRLPDMFNSDMDLLWEGDSFD